MVDEHKQLLRDSLLPCPFRHTRSAFHNTWHEGSSTIARLRFVPAIEATVLWNTKRLTSFAHHMHTILSPHAVVNEVR